MQAPDMSAPPPAAVEEVMAEVREILFGVPVARYPRGILTIRGSEAVIHLKDAEASSVPPDAGELAAILAAEGDAKVAAEEGRSFRQARRRRKRRLVADQAGEFIIPGGPAGRRRKAVRRSLRGY